MNGDSDLGTTTTALTVASEVQDEDDEPVGCCGYAEASSGGEALEAFLQAQRAGAGPRH